MIAVLGAFDGFHKGHALLLEYACSCAHIRGQKWGAVTFDPHPGVFMGSIKDTLFTAQEREWIRLMLQIPELISLKFNQQLADFSPLEFWKYLRDQIFIEGIVVGKDFRFGHDRVGDVSLLELYCQSDNIPFAALDILEYQGTKISSSLLRSHIQAGNCALVEIELGYPYFIWAEVVHGLGRGTKLGFPTANLKIPSDKLLPPEGVYAVSVFIDEAWHPGALSIGKNPTFQDIEAVSVEVFILNYRGDFYGSHLPVFFLERLRSQKKYDQPEELIKQISDDVESCRLVFKETFDKAEPSWSKSFAKIFRAAENTR